jgi:hypothetical protein
MMQDLNDDAVNAVMAGRKLGEYAIGLKNIRKKGRIGSSLLLLVYAQFCEHTKYIEIIPSTRAIE